MIVTFLPNHSYEIKQNPTTFAHLISYRFFRSAWLVTPLKSEICIPLGLHLRTLCTSRAVTKIPPICTHTTVQRDQLSCYLLLPDYSKSYYRLCIASVFSLQEEISAFISVSRSVWPTARLCVTMCMSASGEYLLCECRMNGVTALFSVPVLHASLICFVKPWRIQKDSDGTLQIQIVLLCLGTALGKPPLPPPYIHLSFCVERTSSSHTLLSVSFLFFLFSQCTMWTHK